MPNEDILDPAHEDDVIKDLPTPEPELKVSEDGNMVSRGDVKYVRHEALHEAREQARLATEQLKQLEPLLPDLQDFIRNKREGGAAAVDRSGQGAKSDYTDDELDGYAIVNGLYTADGITPDRKRAEGGLQIIDRIAQRRSGEAVRPIAEQTRADRARTNAAGVRGRMHSDGKPIAEEKYVDAVLASLPAETLADPTVANLTNLIAAGLEYLDIRKQGRQVTRREPVFREVDTGHFDGQDIAERLSPLELAAARARGKSPEQWAKMTASANKTPRGKDPNVLEEI